MKKITLAFLFVLLANTLFGQVRYWIFFTDKPQAETKMLAPEKYLAEASLNRRANQNIAFHESDLPVHAAYINAIQNQGITVVQRSKWLNAVSVFATKNQIEKIKEFDFVKKVKPVMSLQKNAVEFIEQASSEVFKTNAEPYDYGLSMNQIFMLTGQFLHNQNSRGQDIIIAQLDGGYEGVDVLPAFDSLWARGGILATYDFVDNDTNIYHGGTHGMKVLSVMAGLLPNALIGSAPQATYVLLKSENEASETTIEEDNWVAAAEFADSVGASIINSSLGYTVFQDGIGNYTVDDLDGRTATTSLAAVMAARKGILMVNSAGNEGGGAWQTIITPADADSILAVGGVNATRQHAPFSSTGPTADGRIKPDLSAQGSGVYVALPGGNIGPGNGTSFASPLISGLAACLWQRYPTASMMQIRQAILESCDRYDSADNIYGHGIPDFFIADYILSHPTVIIPEPLDDVVLFPNPFNSSLNLFMRLEIYPMMVEVTVTDERGGFINNQTFRVFSKYTELQGFENLASGMYFFRINYAGKEKILKMLR